MDETTIAEIARGFGVAAVARLPAGDRFTQPDWRYEEDTAAPCPAGHAPLRVLRKPYVTTAGAPSKFVALLCATCLAVYELRDLGLKSSKDLERAARNAGQPHSGATGAGVTVLAGQSASAGAPPKPAVASSNAAGVRPTGEQQAIIDAVAAGKNLVVQAGAGTGKTATLTMLTQVFGGKKAIYLAFGKEARKDAQRRFGSSVRCLTTHGLAYSHVVSRYGPRIDNEARQPAAAAAEILGVRQPLRLGANRIRASALARVATLTVDRFCQTSDRELGLGHVPWQRALDPEENAELADTVFPIAVRAWDDIRRVSGKLKFSHDHYLKIWALTDPCVEADVLMLDEAQDSNGCVAKLIQAQQHCQLIAVGDSCQQLFAWRGAVDALESWPADDELCLTQSWRFGQAIADEANKWLSLVPRARFAMRGNPQLDSCIVAELSEVDAVLCRTNGGAMAEAIEFLAAGIPTALAGGDKSKNQIRSYLKAARDLQTSGETDHPELFVFHSWGEVQDYVDTDADGTDLRSIVKLVDDHDLDELLAAVERLKDNTAHARVVVSTAHKSKGLEWNRVRIGEDFTKFEPNKDDDGNLGTVDPAEAMLGYVAVTRAKTHLDRDGLAWIDNYARTVRASKPQPPAAVRTSPRTPAPAPASNRHATISLREHLAAYATLVDVKDRRAVAGNLRRGGYRLWICGDRETGRIVTVTDGLRTVTAEPIEVSLTTEPEQREPAVEVIDIVAESLLVDPSPSVTHLDHFSSRTPLLAHTELHGLIASTLHSPFGRAFTTVNATPPYRIVTLLPVVGPEAETLRAGRAEQLFESWKNSKTRLTDLRRESVFPF